MAIMFPNTSLQSNATKGTVEANGFLVSNANDRAFQAQVDLNTPITTSAGNGNPILWNQLSLNSGSNFSTTNGRYTAPIAGMYLVSAWLMSHNGGANQNFMVDIRYNGGISATGSVRMNSSGYSGHHHGIVDGGHIVRLLANDYIDVAVLNDGGYGVYANEGRYTRFCACYLGSFS